MAFGPDVRLAITTAYGSMSPENIARALDVGPAVRLSVTGEGKKTGRDATLTQPTVRLAHVTGAQGDNNLMGQRGVDQLPFSSAPALLVSYVYLEPFLKAQKTYVYRDWVLDSGAFSAFKSGTTIDLDAYIEKAKELLATDPKLTEVFALDVIGDWKSTLRNTDKMWSEGVPAIPCYHLNEPSSYLLELAKRFPKIALGGVAAARGKKKLEWATECFRQVWPKKIHGFGFGGREAILALPFHSVDATNWELGPCAFGSWKSFGKLSVRGSSQNLRSEVEYYLRLEREARSRWRREMALLDSLDGPDVRVAMGANLDRATFAKTFGVRDAETSPSVRLADSMQRETKDGMPGRERPWKKKPE